MLTEKEGTTAALRTLLLESIIPKLERAGAERFHLAFGEEMLAHKRARTSIDEFECHHFLEVCFCLSGRADIWCGSTLKSLPDGGLLLIPPGVPHSSPSPHCVSSPPAKAFSGLLWIAVLPYGSLLHRCESLGVVHRATGRRLFLNPHAYSYFQSVILELEHEEHDPLIAKYNLILALRWICRARDLPLTSASVDTISTSGSIRASEDTTIGRVKRFLHENFDITISLEKLARLVSTNKSSLCRAFKRETGLSIIEYLTKGRIDTSKKLLLAGLKVSLVAELVGFDDPYYFSRVFKKITGLSPTEFKVQEGVVSHET